MEHSFFELVNDYYACVELLPKMPHKHWPNWNINFFKATSEYKGLFLK